MRKGNAFTNEQTPTEGPPVYYTGPAPRYAAPSLNADAPYVDNPGDGWASPATSDKTRLMTQPTVDFLPNPRGPRGDFYAPMDRDVALRHSVETVDADGWTEQKGTSGKPTAIDPRRVPPPETRPTMKMAPRSYFFTRPFDTGYARLLNGLHFSMADHRRKYEILGMQPVRTARNTFRIEPAPWDANAVDVPPDVQPVTTAGRVQAIDIPPSGNRGWRL